MKNTLSEFWQYRYLVSTFVIRDVKARYKQTYIGVIWVLIQPLLMTIVFTVIFQKLLKVSTDGVPYPVFSFIALALWNFFSRCIQAGSMNLLGARALIQKIYFPREVLPISTMLSSLLDFGIAFLFFILMLPLFRFGVSWTIIFLPLVLLIQIIMATAFVMLTGTVTVIFRDLQFVFPFLVQLLMYASPVVYSARNLTPLYKSLMYLNPITGVIEGYRSIFLYQEVPDLGFLGISAIFAVVLLIISYVFFKRVEKYLADVL